MEVKYKDFGQLDIEYGMSLWELPNTLEYSDLVILTWAPNKAFLMPINQQNLETDFNILPDLNSVERLELDSNCYDFWIEKDNPFMFCFIPKTLDSTKTIRGLIASVCKSCRQVGINAYYHEPYLCVDINGVQTKIIISSPKTYTYATVMGFHFYFNKIQNPIIDTYINQSVLDTMETEGILQLTSLSKDILSNVATIIATKLGTTVSEFKLEAKEDDILVTIMTSREGDPWKLKGER